MCNKHLRNLDLPTSKQEQQQISGSVTATAVARKPCCRQTSLLVFLQLLQLNAHNLAAIGPKQNILPHLPYSSFGNIHDVFPLVEHIMYSITMYSSIAKLSRKCLLCIGEHCLGGLSPYSLPGTLSS